jgi:putative ATP-dependent endonuclease of OLD family
LARQLDIDLDRLNISVLFADGIGFDVFVKVLNALAIEWVMRTDNDIFKIPKKSEYRMAGLQRAVSVYEKNVGTDGDIDRMIKEKKHLFTGFPSKIPPKASLVAVKELITELEIYNIFLSETDLEQDLLAQGLQPSIFKHLMVDTNVDALEQMQKRKATFMFEYLRNNAQVLKKLKKSALAAPLLACQKIIIGSSK